MEKLTFKEKGAYGIGAVGKDMVYMLSANYILYYYQDLLHVSPMTMGLILLIARIFDAFNDPIMGILVAKTKTKWGKFRPWLLIGTIFNAFVLYFLYAAPPSLSGTGLVVYAAAAYIIWGITYTMMDIPFWSMIPAFTTGGSEREGLTSLARSCAGAGSAIVTIITMWAVTALGKGDEVAGFRLFALIIAVLFIAFIIITCLTIKEKSTVDVEAPTVGQMFSALLKNDQAIIVVITIVLVNCSLYLTSNLLIYFFKYDVAGANWHADYTLFNAFGGGIQILSMMIVYPLIRKVMDSIKIFKLSCIMAIAGYAVLFVLMCFGINAVYALFVPAFFIFTAFGLLTVLTTIFLANTVDYGELKNNRRDESVIFSMQTFVVKLASGVAIYGASVCLAVFNISKDTSETASAAASAYSLMGLRGTMSLLPIIGLFVALFIFSKKYILTNEKIEEINQKLAQKN